MNELPDNPLKIFNEWYALAKPLGEQIADGMALATASSSAQPSVRVVLFRGMLRGGLSFYTNYESRKSLSLLENPNCAVSFYWQPQGHQVRIEGRASRTTRAESEAYFRSRPRQSQIGAWASAQSRVIESRSTLEAANEAMTKRFEGLAAIPCPEFWGGFVIQPHLFEFWEERPYRLHDRLQYVLQEDRWSMSRLSP